MAKEIRSWSKPEGIPNLIGKKKVDWSMLRDGTHIPRTFVEDFDKANKGSHISLGEKHDVKLLIDGEAYDAYLTNLNREGVLGDTLQLRYSNMQLKELLRDRFSNTYNYILNERTERDESSREQIIIDDEYAEYIEFYETEEPFRYRLKLIKGTAVMPTMKNDNLARQFAQIFRDKDEAEWAFDLMKDTAIKLGVTGPDDERISIKIRKDVNGLHFSFCPWLVLGFYGPQKEGQKQGPRIRLALIDSLVTDKDGYRAGSFKQEADEPAISLYIFPHEMAKPFSDELRSARDATLDYIKTIFSKWSKSRYIDTHMKEIAAAMFDPQIREQVFTHGIKTEETRKVWWVNQGQTLHLESKEGTLWAPTHAKDGKTIYHWETMKEVQTGDIVLSYASGALRFVSEVISEAVEADRPDSFKEDAWYKTGYLVNLKYHELNPPIDLTRFVGELQKKPIKQGPIDSTGGVKQGYLFRFTQEGLAVIQQAQPETEWPEFAKVNPTTLGYWVFQANPNHYDVVSALIDSKVKTWSVTAHKKEIKKGDKFILWTTGPKSGVYALGTITSDVYKRYNEEPDLKYYKEEPKENRLEGVDLICDLVLVDRPILKDEINNNPLLNDLKVGMQGTNFKATKEEFDELWRIATERIIDTPPLELNPEYTLKELCNDTFIAEDELSRWTRALERKNQAIIYGPPGTGKTYVAELLAKHLIAGGDGFFTLVQFHPAYAYEDFMQGIRAISNDGRLEYPMVKGRFLEFCEEAAGRKSKCVLIIDEINRANLPRVFGELMYLLEYRDRKIPLSGGGELSIPKNVYLIGTMNTADRSIALVDHALRRRFAFLSLRPNYDILRKFHVDKGNAIEGLIKVLNQINKQIGDPHYEIGVSFFLRKDLKGQLEDIWQMEIEPYLEEYFFDQSDKVKEFQWESIREQVTK